MGRWIAVDYGLRRIGIAIADPRGTLASPADTLKSLGIAPEDAASILRWAEKNDPGGLVVGLPLNMDGSDSTQTRLTRALADELRRRTPLPIELWDERLSSFQAEQHLDAAGVRASKRKSLRDALAAQVILQSFLDARRSAGPTDGSPNATR